MSDEQTQSIVCYHSTNDAYVIWKLHNVLYRLHVYHIYTHINGGGGVGGGWCAKYTHCLLFQINCLNLILSTQLSGVRLTMVSSPNTEQFLEPPT